MTTWDEWHKGNLPGYVWDHNELHLTHGGKRKMAFLGWCHPKFDEEMEILIKDCDTIDDSQKLIGQNFQKIWDKYKNDNVPQNIIEHCKKWYKE